MPVRRYKHARPESKDPLRSRSLPKRSATALALCALLGGAGPIWAGCNGVSSGTLKPNSGVTVTCGGTSFVSIDNPAASNVTVTVSSVFNGSIDPGPKLPPINLGQGATIVNDGTITGIDVPGDLGAVTVRGAGNRIKNGGTIRATNGSAIQGQVNGAETIGAVLENSGVISASSSSLYESAVQFGIRARVDNSGDIKLVGDFENAALDVGDGSQVNNLSSGLIRAEEAPGAVIGDLLAVQMSGGSTLVNAGKIEVVGDVNGPPRGTAIHLTGAGSTVENSGAIDASRAEEAVIALGRTTIINSGTILGGADGAILIFHGDGSEVTLRQGSVVDGQILVRGSFGILPSQATLGLEGSGTEDDLITGFTVIEKRGAGAWTLSTDLQAGSATDGYKSGDFRGPLDIGVDDAGGLLDLSGAISDNPDGTLAGISKVGPGTLRLSGASPGTGRVFVIAGTLDAAGTTAMTAPVGANGTVLGSGTLGGIDNHGRVAPGNSVGTLNVSGNYTQRAGGTLEIEIKPDGSGNDLLAVGGTASLAGTLTAKGENGALLTPGAGGKTYTILTAGGVSGRFGTEPGPLGAFTFDTLYHPNDVQLGVTYHGFTPIQTGAAITGAPTPGVIPGTGTANQISKAIALDRIPIRLVAAAQPPAGGQPPAAGQPPAGGQPATLTYNSGNADFDRILLEIANETPDELAATYNAIIAEPYAAFLTVLLEQNDFYAETVLERAQLCSLRGRGSLAGGFSARQLAAGETQPASCADNDRHNVWIDAAWLNGNIDGSDGLSGYDYRLAGAVIGADTAVGTDAAVGLTFGFGQPKLDNYDLASAEIDGDSYYLGTYGTLTRDRWEFFGLLGYSFGSYESERNIRFGSIDRTAKGDFDGDGFIASAKAAYDYPVEGFDLIPEIGITYSKIWQDGFTEKGADSLNLKVDDADAHSLITSVGVRIGTEIQTGNTSIRPQALLRYEYDWNASDDEAHDIVSTFAAVPAAGSIDIVGQNRGEHGLLLAGGVTAQVSENANLFAGAGYRWGSNGEEYNFGLGARMAW